MKNPLQTLGLLLGAACLVSSCDWLQSADDVEKDFEFEVVFEADENGTGTNVNYYDEETLDLSTTAAADYIDRIKKVEITKITYRIESFQSEPPGTKVYFNNGTATFADPDSGNDLFSVSYAASASGVDLQTATAETELDISEEQFNTVADLLLDKKKVTLKSQGILTSTPVSFNVVSTWYVTITANALN